MLMILGVVAIVAAFFALTRTAAPERLGLRKSPAERLLSGAPDRGAARQILDDIAAAGVDTTGISVYVLPIEGRPYRAAYAVLDSSAGFGIDRSGGEDPLLAYLVSLATSDTAEASEIGRAAIDYRDETGESTLVLTAPVSAIRAFAAGETSREDFMKQLDGRASLPQIYEEVLP